MDKLLKAILLVAVCSLASVASSQDKFGVILEAIMELRTLSSGGISPGGSMDTRNCSGGGGHGRSFQLQIDGCNGSRCDLGPNKSHDFSFQWIYGGNVTDGLLFELFLSDGFTENLIYQNYLHKNFTPGLTYNSEWRMQTGNSSRTRDANLRLRLGLTPDANPELCKVVDVRFLRGGSVVLN